MPITWAPPPLGAVAVAITAIRSKLSLSELAVAAPNTCCVIYDLPPFSFSLDGFPRIALRSGHSHSACAWSPERR